MIHGAVVRVRKGKAMNRWTLACAWLLAGTLAAAEKSPSVDRDGIPSERASVEEKREWMRKMIRQKVSDEDEAAKYESQLERMSAGQVNVAIEKMRLEVAQARRTANQNEATRDQLGRTAQRQSGAGAGAGGAGFGGNGFGGNGFAGNGFGGNGFAGNGYYPNGGRVVGYAPVITWLPEGATMNVGAVVSPDRRYVRINAQPFFSSIPGYSTFNYATGQSAYYPLTNGPIVQNGFPQQQAPVVQRQAPRPQMWFDGVRWRER